jgi:hypothetical protein
MLAVQLHAPGLDGLAVEEIETPRARAGEALVEVHAAAITRDELEWPVDRLPAIPSYELSGVVVDVADDVQAVAVGDAVYALTAFDRDGVAAAYAAVPASLLAPKPSTLDHVESATIPLPALSAWQGLFDHGRLEPGHRVLVTDTMGRLAPEGLIGIHTNLLVPALNGPMPTDTDEETRRGRADRHLPAVRKRQSHRYASLFAAWTATTSGLASLQAHRFAR